MADGSTELAVEHDADPEDTKVRYSWRVTCPINRDAVCLQIIKYEWEPYSENGTVDKGRSFVLVLSPEPHWQEYKDFEIIPDSTVELDGLSMVLSGLPRNQWPTPFDPRQIFADRMDSKVKEAIEAVMHLEPAVEFDESSGM